MAELIATGRAQADSSDFTLADGQSTTIFLKDASYDSVPAQCAANVQIKSADSVYYTIHVITARCPAIVLDAPGTYRVRKQASITTFGVDRT